MLEDEKTRRKCYEVVEEARGRTGMNMEEKRKKKRKEAIAKGLPPTGNNIKVCDNVILVKLEHRGDINFRIYIWSFAQSQW